MLTNKSLKFLSRRFFTTINTTTINPSSCLSKEIVQQRVAGVLSSHSILTSEINLNDHFIANLHLDRLRVRNIIQSLSSEFRVNVSFSDAEKIVSVETATEYFSNHPKAR